MRVPHKPVKKDYTQADVDAHAKLTPMFTYRTVAERMCAMLTAIADAQLDFEDSDREFNFIRARVRCSYRADHRDLMIRLEADLDPDHDIGDKSSVHIGLISAR